MKLVPTAMTRTLGRQILVAKKNSPQIFFVGGVLGMVTSTILACRATLKLELIIHDVKKNMERIKSTHAMATTENGVVPVEGHKNEYNKQMTLAYLDGLFQISKLYAPAVVVGGISITAITGSHVALTRRNAALSAAYAGMAEAYKNYRERVREELGEDREREIYHAAAVKELVDSDGKKFKAMVADPSKWSPYARMFDETSSYWQKDQESNRHFVTLQQTFANEMLHAKGHLFLNEVYDLLGLDRSKAGCVVGWTVNSGGDDYVDFGIFEAHSVEFMEGREPTVVLDFNVDGEIDELI